MNCSLNQLINTALEQFLENPFTTSSESKLISSILKSSFGTQVEAIVLFGSVAKCESTETSDYDLLIVLSQNVEIKRSLYKAWDNEVEPLLTLDLTAGKAASPHFVCLRSDLNDIHGLWLEVAISGKTIWMKDNKTNILLNNIRLAISQNRFTRKLTHGQPYWIRN